MEEDEGPAQDVSVAVLERKTINLILGGMKPMLALRKTGLEYKSRSSEYRRLTRKAGRLIAQKENENTKSKLERAKIQSKQLLRIKQGLQEERDWAITRCVCSSSVSHSCTRTITHLSTYTHAHAQSLTYHVFLCVHVRAYVIY